jgi:hypothetical protein
MLYKADHVRSSGNISNLYSRVAVFDSLTGTPIIQTEVIHTTPHSLQSNIETVPSRTLLRLISTSFAIHNPLNSY